MSGALTTARILTTGVILTGVGASGALGAVLAIDHQRQVADQAAGSTTRGQGPDQQGFGQQDQFQGQDQGQLPAFPDDSGTTTDQGAPQQQFPSQGQPRVRGSIGSPQTRTHGS